MINDNKILGIITARGGSKRLHKKNLFIFRDKPLIYWTINSALKSKYIDKVIVSSDSKEIMDLSIKYGAEVPFKRPVGLSQDNSSSESVILHALTWLRNNNNDDYKYESKKFNLCRI